MKINEIMCSQVALPYDVEFQKVGGTKTQRRLLVKGEKVDCNKVSNKGSGVLVKLSTVKDGVKLKAELAFDSEQEAKSEGF